MRTAAAALFLNLCLAAPLAAQTTLFTTQDYRADQARWTDPAYYLFNTARQLTDMQVENRFGQKVSGADEYVIKSPYPFQTSLEHYEAYQRLEGGADSDVAAWLVELRTRVNRAPRTADAQP